MKYFVLYSTLAFAGLSVIAAPLEQAAAPVPAPALWHDKHTVVGKPLAQDVSSSGDGASEESLERQQRQPEHDQDAASEGQLQKRQADPALLSLFGSPEKILEYFASLNQPRQPNLLDVLIGDLSGVVPAVTGLLDGVLDLLLPPVPSPAVPRVTEPTIVRQYSPEAVLSALSSIGYGGGTGLGLMTTTVCVATATIPIPGYPTVTVTRLATVTAGPVPIIVQGLTALEGAIASVLNEVIPSELLPGVTIAASANLPLGLSPAISLTVPGLSIPAFTLPPLPTVTVTLPSVSVPSVSLPSLPVPSLSLPTLPPAPTLPSISLPSVSLPSISVPSVSLPSVSLPSVSLPSLSLPSLSVPSISVPSISIPSISLPSVSLPSVSLPSVSIPTLPPFPSVSLPSISLPSVSLPSVSLPSIALPTVTLPSISLPSVSLPSVALPTVSLPSLSLPSLTLPTVSLPDLPSLALPTVSLPSLSLPSISLPSLALPTVSLPSLSLPSVALPTLPATLLPGVTIPGTRLPGLTISPPPGLTISVGGISANLPVVGTVGVPPLIDLTVNPSGLTASGRAIPAVTIPPLVIPSPVQAILPNILSQLSQAIATETPLVPGLIAVINGLIPVPTPVITQPIGSNIPIPTGAPILPNLLSEIGAAVNALPSAIPGLLSSLEVLLLPEPTFSILPFPPLPTVRPEPSFSILPFPNPPIQLPTLSILPFPPIATLFPNVPILTALPTITFPPLPTAIPTLLTSTRPPPFINLGPPITPPNILASLLPLPTSPVNTPQGYRFNAMSNSNVAVYYGQSQASERISLADTCADPNVDMVILGFVTHINYQNSGLPKLTLAPVIKGVKNGYQRVFAPGLDYYAQLEEDIKTCQATHGKKVLVSLGGGGSSLVLRSETEATQFANRLWQLFGPVTPATTSGHEFVNGLRPFGTAVVDGFDLAKLDSSPNYWGTFALRMRANFLSDLSKQYYLSAAPGCSSPDRSIPIGYLAQANFIWPRYFGGDDTGRCEIGGENFLTSILSW
ncbi:family 18 putative glycoside hydrolase [Cercophora samala]|uniref:Family 18 putative glycoside hydrolase n=1 Tax=Cercophora samala TaxID=330535 RepID=A0AA39Z8N8_9PEZI|nr:family 18 putative glycoside hydrolase [Cercophora samala]